MQKTSTPLKKVKKTQLFRPDRAIVERLLLYSKSLQLLPLTDSQAVLWCNN